MGSGVAASDVAIVVTDVSVSAQITLGQMPLSSWTLAAQGAFCTALSAFSHVGNVSDVDLSAAAPAAASRRLQTLQPPTGAISLSFRVHTGPSTPAKAVSVFNSLKAAEASAILQSALQSAGLACSVAGLAAPAYSTSVACSVLVRQPGATASLQRSVSSMAPSGGAGGAALQQSLLALGISTSVTLTAPPTVVVSTLMPPPPAAPERSPLPRSGGAISGMGAVGGGGAAAALVLIGVAIGRRRISRIAEETVKAEAPWAATQPSSAGSVDCVGDQKHVTDAAAADASPQASPDPALLPLPTPRASSRDARHSSDAVVVPSHLEEVEEASESETTLTLVDQSHDDIAKSACRARTHRPPAQRRRTAAAAARLSLRRAGAVADGPGASASLSYEGARSHVESSDLGPARDAAARLSGYSQEALDGDDGEASGRAAATQRLAAEEARRLRLEWEAAGAQVEAERKILQLQAERRETELQAELKKRATTSGASWRTPGSSFAAPDAHESAAWPRVLGPHAAAVPLRREQAGSARQRGAAPYRAGPGWLLPAAPPAPSTLSILRRPAASAPSLDDQAHEHCPAEDSVRPFSGARHGSPAMLQTLDTNLATFMAAESGDADCQLDDQAPGLRLNHSSPRGASGMEEVRVTSKEREPDAGSRSVAGEGVDVSLRPGGANDSAATQSSVEPRVAYADRNTMEANDFKVEQPASSPQGLSPAARSPTARLPAGMTSLFGNALFRRVAPRGDGGAADDDLHGHPFGPAAVAERSSLEMQPVAEAAWRSNWMATDPDPGDEDGEQYSIAWGRPYSAPAPAQLSPRGSCTGTTPPSLRVLGNDAGPEASAIFAAVAEHPVNAAEI